MPKSNNNTIAPPPTSSHLNLAEGSYLETTCRPFYSLAFLLPLILVYEIGTLLVNTNQLAHTQARVAAFTWLLAVAEWMRLDPASAWAFPGFVVTVILLCWHIATRHSWQLQPIRLLWMAAECLVLSVPLFVFGALVNSSTGTPMAAGATEPAPYLANLVTSIGAGIYEELVFRFILIGLIMLLIENVLQLKGFLAPMVAVSVSALLFAAHHYVGIEAGVICRLSAEPFTLVGFIFRTMAGVYFAIVFRYRGYGITAGTHAVYNMIYFTFSP